MEKIKHQDNRRDTLRPYLSTHFRQQRMTGSITGVGKIDTNRISIHDLTAKRVYFEPIGPNK